MRFRIIAGDMAVVVIFPLKSVTFELPGEAVELPEELLRKLVDFTTVPVLVIFM